jgi:signal transduction histidine kinase
MTTTSVTNAPDVVASDAYQPTAWQARSDLLGRRLLLPLLGAATALAALSVSGGYETWSRFDYGLLVVAVAAIWATALIRYPVTGVAARTRALVFGFHVVVGGALVWFNPWYGVFAFTGYFLADELPMRWRKVGFAATALVLAGSQTGSYPSGWNAHCVVYALMVVFNLVVVLTMVGLTNRVMQQNTERGSIIDELGEANRRLEATMAENAGLHAQLLLQARDAGMLDERQRLAGEIHDTLAQGLTGIITQLEAARQSRHDPAEWERHLDLADQLARANLTDARRSVRALRPEQLEDASLPEAVGSLACDWSQRSAIAAEVETTGTAQRGDPDVEAAVFRVAQEALANVAKHAQATKVHLTLSYLDDMLLLDVADNGTGFEASCEASEMTTGGGYGLAGMRRRIEGLTGTLNVESTPGYGTTINAAVPLRTAAG